MDDSGDGHGAVWHAHARCWVLGGEAWEERHKQDCSGRAWRARARRGGGVDIGGREQMPGY